MQSSALKYKLDQENTFDFIELRTMGWGCSSGVEHLQVLGPTFSPQLQGNEKQNKTKPRAKVNTLNFF